MESLLAIIIYAAVIYWCTWVAQKNKRDVPLAAFWAALFGIFAVAAYYIMGTKSEDIYKNVKEYNDDGKGKNASFDSKVE